MHWYFGNVSFKFNARFKEYWNLYCIFSVANIVNMKVTGWNYLTGNDTRVTFKASEEAKNSRKLSAVAGEVEPILLDMCTCMYISCLVIDLCVYVPIWQCLYVCTGNYVCIWLYATLWSIGNKLVYGSCGYWFDCVTSLGKLFTHTYFCHQAEECCK